MPSCWCWWCRVFQLGPPPDPLLHASLRGALRRHMVCVVNAARELMALYTYYTFCRRAAGFCAVLFCQLIFDAYLPVRGAAQGRLPRLACAVQRCRRLVALAAYKYIYIYMMKAGKLWLFWLPVPSPSAWAVRRGAPPRGTAGLTGEIRVTWITCYLMMCGLIVV